MRSNHKSFHPLKHYAWYSLSAVICVALLWLPFGFSLGGWIEEWDLLLQIKKHSGFWNSFPGNPMSDYFAARPLQILPFYIANSISSHSFLGFHLLLISICFVRIAAAAIIGRYLFNNSFYGLVLGLLAFLIPADTQHLIFRTINISSALALMLSSAALLIIALNAKSSLQKWLAISLSMFLAITAVLIYEPIFSLYLIAPLALFAREGGRASLLILQQMRVYFIVWLIAPVTNILYLFYTVIIYQSKYQVAASQNQSLSSVVHNLQYLLKTAAFRIFYHGWLESAQIVYHHVVRWSFLLICLAIFSLILWKSSKEQPNQSRSASGLWRIIAAGLILFIAAYLPYMVSLPHLLITQRTLMASSFGASLIIVAILKFALGKNRIPALLIIASMLFLGFIAQLYQIDNYTSQYTNVIRPYMAIITDRVSPDKKIHLIIDKTGLGGYLGGMYVSKIVTGPAVRLNKPDDSFILCKDREPTLLMAYSQCELKNGVWRLSDANGNVSQIPASEAEAIIMDDDFDANYQAANKNWQDLGSFQNSKSLFRHASPQADWFSCSADSDWGYTRFCRGDGWADGLPWRYKMRQQNYIIAISPTASLKFMLKPAAADYKLQIQLFKAVNNFVFSQLKIFINGVPIHFDLKANHILEANFKGALLKTGINTIGFKNSLPELATSGLAFENFLIAPSESSHVKKTVSEPALILLSDKWIKPSDSNADKILLSGYSIRTKIGTWTDGKIATMRVFMPSDQAQGSLVIEGAPYLNENHRKIDISAEIKGTIVASKMFSHPGAELFTIPISKENLSEDGSVIINLIINDPASPPQGDNRKLGLFISRFKLQYS